MAYTAQVMTSEIVKVYYPEGEGTQFAYCETRGSFHAFIENINSFIGKCDMDAYYFEEGASQRYRMFWTDEDNDKVMINSDYTLGIFLKRNTGIKKVYIVEKNAFNIQPEVAHKQAFIPPTESSRQKPESTSTPMSADADNTIHSGVQCDGCGALPIKGFRYKCAQCYDFDLCMQCEQKKMHCDHVMYRFPVALPKEAYMNRRFFKKMRHGVFGRQSEPEHPRRCGRKRHEHDGGAGATFTNFYTMMCDLAEGIDQEDIQNAAGDTARKDGSTQNNAGNTARKEDDAKNTAEAPRTEEVPIIGLPYTTAGIEVLQNFSQLFGKLLDPLGITVEVDIGRKGEKKEKKPENEGKPANEKNSNEKSNETEKSASQQQQEPKETEDATAPEPEQIINNETLQSMASSSSSISITKSSSNQSVQVNSNDQPAVDTKIQSSQTEQQEQQSPAIDSGLSSVVIDGANKKKDSIGVDSGWTMIDKHFDDSRNNTPTSEHADSTRASLSPPKDIDYPKLSQDLLDHIQNEKKMKQSEIETRAQIVYHHDKKINNAVIAMMAMGFSNEGNWLTNLLETVSGDIPRALELLHPSR